MTIASVEAIPTDLESGTPDAALRKQLDAALQPKAAFPYPKSGV
jgi:hypothetical protein